MLVFIRTRSGAQAPQYGRSVTVPLRLPSSDTLQIVNAALAGLDRIYRSGFDYAKAGVMLLELQPATQNQRELELGDDAVLHSGARPADARARCRQRPLRPRHAHAGQRRRARARPALDHEQERRTPRYTTCWDELLTVSA